MWWINKVRFFFNYIKKIWRKLWKKIKILFILNWNKFVLNFFDCLKEIIMEINNREDKGWRDWNKDKENIDNESVRKGIV